MLARRDLTNPEDRRKTQAEVSSIQERFEQKTRQQQERVDALQNMLSPLDAGERGPADRFTAALRRADFQAAQQEIARLSDQLKNGDLTEDQKQRLGEQLASLSEQLQDMADEQAEQQQQSLDEMKQALENAGVSENQAEELAQPDTSPAKVQEALQQAQNQNPPADTNNDSPDSSDPQNQKNASQQQAAQQASQSQQQAEQAGECQSQAEGLSNALGQMAKAVQQQQQNGSQQQSQNGQPNQPGDASASQSVQQAQQQLGEMNEQSQQLQQMQQTGEKLQQAQQALNQAQQSQQGQQAGSGQQPGQSPGQQSSQGQQPGQSASAASSSAPSGGGGGGVGPGEGDGSGGNPLGERGERQAAGSHASHDIQDGNGGRVTTSWTRGVENEGGPVTVDNDTSLTTGRAEAERALSEDQAPKRYHRAIREYFEN